MNELRIGFTVIFRKFATKSRKMTIYPTFNWSFEHFKCVNIFGQQNTYNALPQWKWRVCCSLVIRTMLVILSGGWVCVRMFSIWRVGKFQWLKSNHFGRLNKWIQDESELMNRRRSGKEENNLSQLTRVSTLIILWLLHEWISYTCIGSSMAWLSSLTWWIHSSDDHVNSHHNQFNRWTKGGRKRNEWKEKKWPKTIR